MANLDFYLASALLNAEAQLIAAHRRFYFTRRRRQEHAAALDAFCVAAKGLGVLKGLDPELVVASCGSHFGPGNATAEKLIARLDELATLETGNEAS